GRAYETAAPAVWFLAVDSKGIAKTGEPYEWRAPVRIKVDVKRTSSGHRVSLSAIPRAASIRVTFDGSDPKQAAEVPPGELDAPSDAKRLRAIAVVGGSQFSAEETAPLPNGLADQQRNFKPKPTLKPDAPATMTSRFDPKNTESAFKALDQLAKITDTKVYG